MPSCFWGLEAGNLGPHIKVRMSASKGHGRDGGQEIHKMEDRIQATHGLGTGCLKMMLMGIEAKQIWGGKCPFRHIKADGPREQPKVKGLKAGSWENKSAVPGEKQGKKGRYGGVKGKKVLLSPEKPPAGWLWSS